MKKLLYFLAITFTAISLLSSCGGGDDTVCTEHRDADDDRKCDVCMADFEDGVECSHVDKDDNGYCDECYEVFEDGTDIAEGTIYSEYVTPAIVYKLGDVPYVITSVTTVRDYLRTHALVSTSVFNDGQTGYENEIVFGDTTRQISLTAMDMLEDKLAKKAAELEEDGMDTSDLSGYLIYSDGTSVAIVWTDFQLAGLAVDYFSKTYLNETSLILEEGYTYSSFLSLGEYLVEREAEILERKWASLEAAIPEAYREDIITEYKNLYSLYNDEIVIWLANLYDGETGGFYYSNSARDTEGYFPDIETTFYCHTMVGYTGMAEMFDNRWELAIPIELLERTSEWLKAMKDEDGYYYHPQWPKSFIQERGAQLRISRDRGSANTLINKIAAVPKYTGYGVNNEILHTNLGTGTAIAVSKVVAAAELLTEYQSTENYKNYLAKQEASIKNMNDSQKASFFYTFGSYTQSNQGIMSAEIKQMFVDFCDKYQNPENGVWSENLYYNSTNAIHKIGSVYNNFGAELKYVEEMVDSCFEILMWDPKEKPAGNTCDIYNVWTCFPYIYKNIRNCSQGDIDERNARCDEIKAQVFAGAAAALRGTYAHVAECVKPGYTFSTSRGNTSKTVYGCPICPGAYEGDVPGFLFASYDIPYYVLDALELASYKIPLFTEEDRVKYVGIMSEIANPTPIEIKPSDPVVYDFEKETVGEAPSSVKISPDSSKDAVDKAYVKVVDDGSGNKSLEFNAVISKTAKENYSAAVNVNHTSEEPTAFSLEFDLKLDSSSATNNKLISITLKDARLGKTVCTFSVGRVLSMVYLYDNSGNRIAKIGKTNQTISLKIDYTLETGACTVTADGSIVAETTFTPVDLPGSVEFSTPNNTSAKYWLDDICFKTYKAE